MTHFLAHPLGVAQAESVSAHSSSVLYSDRVFELPSRCRPRSRMLCASVDARFGVGHDAGWSHEPGTL